MLKDLSYEEIQEYFKKLDGKPMNEFHKAQIYNMAKAYGDIEQKEKAIRDQFEDKRWCIVHEIFIINDDYQIAKVERKDSKEIIYHIFINYKRINECAESFDKAMITAIAYKYSNTTIPATYVENNTKLLVYLKIKRRN